MVAVGDALEGEFGGFGALGGGVGGAAAVLGAGGFVCGRPECV